MKHLQSILFFNFTIRNYFNVKDLIGWDPRDNYIPNQMYEKCKYCHFYPKGNKSCKCKYEY